MAKKERQEDTEEKPRETTVEFLASLAAVLVTGLFIITFVLQAFEIPSSSMENTLLIGDHVFVNRVQFAPATHWMGPLLPYRDIRRQDIVVFLSPAEPGLYVVKRIIGVPGDRIHLRNGEVFRNGEKLNEPYVIHNTDEGPNDYRDNFPAVPPSDYNRSFPTGNKRLPQYIQGDDLVVPPTVISRWATIATSATTAASGDLFPRKMLSAGRCSFTGLSKRRPTSICIPRSASALVF